MRRFLTCLLVLLLAHLKAPAQSKEWRFKVEHISIGPNHQGTVTVGGTGIEFRPDREKQPIAWEFGDIQQLKLQPPYIEILTYEDQKWKLGRDRVFRFKVREGSLDNALSEFLRHKISGVFVTSVLRESPAIVTYKARAKHRSLFGGSDGTLEFYDASIVYRSGSDSQSRAWLFDQILAFSFPSQREFELVTEEKKFGGPTRTYRFQLKERLPESVYDFLWARTYGTAFSSGRNSVENPALVAQSEHDRSSGNAYRAHREPWISLLLRLARTIARNER